MPAEINWKNKYLELRSKYINDIDIAFRLGYEQGMQGAQQQQAEQDQAAMEQQQQAEAQGMGGGAPGEGGAPQPGDEGGQPPAGGEGQPSEMDQHIGKLESMLSNNSDPEVKKSLNALVTLRKADAAARELRKSADAIPGIVKALHKQSFKLGVNAAHNMNDNAKKTVTLQQKIVGDIFKSWSDQEANATKDIVSILENEALLKG